MMIIPDWVGDMLKKWHLQQSRHYIIFALVFPLILPGLMLGHLFPDSEAAEQKGVAALRAMIAQSNRPPEAELRRIESEFPRTRAAGLARFLRGYMRYAAGDFATAATILSDSAIEKKTLLGDHALYLTASSYTQLKRSKEAEQAFARLVDKYPDSIFAREAGFTAMQLALTRADYQQAISYLDQLADGKDPGALLQIAWLHDQSGEPKKALGLYQEIYFDLPPSREALEAEKKLVAAGLLASGSATVPYSRLRERFERLYQVGAYADAVQVYENFLTYYPEAAKDDELTLHYGRSLYELPSLGKAIQVLDGLESKSSEIHSEALWALAESYLRSGQTTAFIETSRALVKRYPQTSWAARTLYSRAMYYWRTNDDQPAISALKELVKLYPQSQYAREATYRLGVKAYFAGRYGEAAQYLIDHVAHYVNSDYYGPALYWAGRATERDGHPEPAVAIFERLLDRYRYSYYGQMASERLKALRPHHIKTKQVTLELDSILSQALAQVKPAQPPEESLNQTGSVHLKKAQELRLVRVDDPALQELQSALKLSPGSCAVSLELARLYRDQGKYRLAINVLQQAHPEYTLYQGGEVSREVEEILFPLANWDTIRQESGRSGLDPYLVAGLIRQESAFDPNARSHANARGLMQLIPSTGRLVARHYGLRRISPSQLYDPELNIRLGTSFFAGLVKQFGRVECAAAAYNGGPARTARWLRELPHQEMDEWVENIPIRETRLYIQAVIRNAAHYRRLYGQQNQPTGS
jgi:soluble lytic murein transglycosylase